MNKREAALATYNQLLDATEKLRAEYRWLEDAIATNKRILGMSTAAHANAQPPVTASER